MGERLWPWIVFIVAVVYAACLTAMRVWEEPASFLFGGITGLTVGIAWHYFEQIKSKDKERAYREYASYVANTVSLVYLKHGPCPACGHSATDDYADGFGSHSAVCPILAEIVEFGRQLEP